MTSQEKTNTTLISSAERQREEDDYKETKEI